MSQSNIRIKECHDCVLNLFISLYFYLFSGEYYCQEEACEAVQESLSSSSLRRKLFLNGHVSYSGSDSSGPPSPERCDAREERASLKEGGEPPDAIEAISSIFSSPLSCRVSAQTPSTVGKAVCQYFLFCLL